MKLILIVDNFNIRKIEYGKDNSIRFIKKQKKSKYIYNKYQTKKLDNTLILKINNISMNYISHILTQLFSIKKSKKYNHLTYIKY